MKIKFSVIAIFVMLMFTLAFDVCAFDGGYIVKLKDTDVPCELTELLVEVNREHGIYSVDSLDKIESYRDYIEYIEENEEVVLIDEVPQISLFALRQDSLFSLQRQHLELVKAEFAWDMETYGNEVNVAVIDTGCNHHVDLNIAGGYDFILDNDDYTDNNGHGTHVAGIISAQHNKIGIAGIAPKVNIYALKVIDPSYDSSTVELVEAIYAAVDDFDCKVINMSLGAGGNVRALHEAVKYAESCGVILVAAAGNDGDKEKESERTKLFYPASYSEVVSVGSVSLDKKRSTFSQQNKYVNVMAPGEVYPSTFGNDEYYYMTGTSQATPIVASTAAILLAANKDMTPAMFRNYISKCSEALTDEYCGSGLLNIEAMFRECIKDKDYYVSPINEDGVLIYNNTADNLGAFGVFAEFEDEQYVSGKIHEVYLSPGQKTKINSIAADETLKFFLWSPNLRPLANTRILEM